MGSVELRRYWAKIDDYRSLLREDPDRDPNERKFKEYSRKYERGKEICIEIIKVGL